MVRRALTHLRSQESRSAHSSYSGVPLVYHASTAKVADLDTPIRRQQHVVWLQITVHNVFRVQVVQALEQQQEAADPSALYARPYF